MVYRTTASYMEKPYSVPVRCALYGEDHTVAGLLGDYLWVGARRLEFKKISGLGRTW
jgi:hypothetical protein